jgi:hypothetical protein
MDKRQTAVDWLVKEFNLEEYEATIKLAKAMEKEQIMDANEDCSTNELGELLSGEQYYNETYGK